MDDLYFKEKIINETIVTKKEDKELFKKYLVDIRNLKILDKESIQNIPNMEREEIINILNAYNDVTDAFCKFIESLKK